MSRVCMWRAMKMELLLLNFTLYQVRVMYINSLTLTYLSDRFRLTHLYIIVMLAVQSRKRKRLHNKISQNETGEDTNFDIVVKKNKKKSDKPKGMTASEKNARRKYKKKLEKIKEKKEQKEERERILKSLEEHSISSEQLNLFHSSCGRKPNTLLVREQVKRSAVIVNHKKKKKKCSGRLDKLLNPVEETPKVPSSSESSSESETDTPKKVIDTIPASSSVEETTAGVVNVPESVEPVVTTPQRDVKRCSQPKEQAPRKPSAFVR